MKRRWLIWVAVLLCCTTLATMVGAEGTVLPNDEFAETETPAYALNYDFEGDAEGDFVAVDKSIKFLPKQFSAKVTTFDGDKCVKLDHTNAQDISGQMDLMCEVLGGGTEEKYGLKGTWVFSYDVYFENLGTEENPAGWLVGMLRMVPESGAQFQQSTTIRGNKLIPYQNVNAEALMTIELGRWYNMAVEYDMVKKTMSTYVDGVLVSEKLAWNVADMSATQADCVRTGWSGGTFDGVAYIDNIRAYNLSSGSEEEVVIPSGTCGENLTWTLDDGILTISGTGAMSDFPTPGSQAWDAVLGEIRKVVVNDGVTSLGFAAFKNCTNLSIVHLPNSLQTIGKRAFEGCSNLTNVVIPNGVTLIDEFAFSGCTSLATVSFPANLTRVAQGVFKNCSSLTTFSLPDKVTDLGPSALSGCTKLEYVKLSAKQPAINNATFANCTSLKKVEIPESVKNIAGNGFENCPNVVLYCGSGSAAHSFAQANSIPFVLADQIEAAPLLLDIDFEDKALGDFVAVDKSIKFFPKQFSDTVTVFDGDKCVLMDHMNTQDISGKFDNYVDLLMDGLKETWGVGDVWTFSYDVWFDTVANGSTPSHWQIGMLRISSSTGTKYQHIATIDGNRINKYQNGEYTGYNIPVGRWVELASEFDMKNRTMSLYMDGVCILYSIPWDVPASEDDAATQIRTGWMSSIANSAAYVDNFKAYNSTYGNYKEAEEEDRQYSFGQISFAKRKNAQNKDQETFSIRTTGTPGQSTAALSLNTVSNTYDDANGRSKGFPFTASFRWTGKARAEIPNNAYVLYYVDEAKCEVDILAVVDQDPSDNIYTFDGYIRGFDSASDTIYMGSTNTAYTIGHGSLKNSPLLPGKAQDGQNEANNTNIIQPRMNNYVQLVLVDDKVVFVANKSATQDYMIIDSFVSFDADGITANVWNTVTDSYEQVKLAEFNGWSLGGLDANNIPVQLKTLYQIVYKNSTGYNLTLPASFKNTELIVNPYGYIVGTNGNNSYGDQFYVATNANDYWMILDRQGNVMTYRGKVSPVVAIQGNVYKARANDYVIVVEDFSSVQGINNLQGNIKNYLIFSTAISGAQNSDWIQNHNNYDVLVPMQNIQTGAVVQVRIEPGMIYDGWDGRYESLGLENGCIYRTDDGILLDLQTYSIKEAVQNLSGSSWTYGKAQLWSGTQVYDVRKAVAVTVMQNLFPDASSDEMLTSLINSVTVYVQTQDENKSLTAKETDVNAVLSVPNMIYDVHFLYNQNGKATAWIGASRSQDEMTTKFMMYNSSLFSNSNFNYTASFENGIWNVFVPMTDVLNGTINMVRLDPQLIPAGWDGTNLAPIGLREGVIYRTKNEILSSTQSYTFADVKDFYGNSVDYDGFSITVMSGTNVNNIKTAIAQNVVHYLFPEWLGNPNNLITATRNKVRLYAQTEDAAKTLTTNTTQIDNLLSQAGREFTVYYVVKEDSSAVAWLVPEQSYSGTCGENLTWKLDDTGVLTISGTGAMAEYTNTSQPSWSQYKSLISDVVVSEGVTSISNYAFSGCSALKSLTLSSSVTSIGTRAFQGCANLEAPVFPNNLNSIGDYAFFGCNGLTRVTIPASVTLIGDAAFTSCRNLTEFIVDSANMSYTALNGILFSKDGTLLHTYPIGKTDTEYVIPSGVTEVGVRAFQYSALNNVKIPEGIKHFGIGAFYGCNKLTSVTLPSTLSSVADLMFTNCSNLTEINVASENTFLTSVNGVLFRKDGSILYIYPQGKTDTTYTVPAGVKTVGTYAFGNSRLSEIHLPESVTIIASSSFANCKSLTSMELPNGVKSIFNSAFSGCTNLKSITIPESVTTIENAAFNGCNNVTIYGYAGSCADTYAFRYSIPFVSIGMAQTPSYVLDKDFEGESEGDFIVVDNSIKFYPKQGSAKVTKFGDTLCVRLDRTNYSAISGQMDCYCDVLAGGTADAWGLRDTWVLSYDMYLEQIGTAEKTSNWQVAMLRMTTPSGTQFQQSTYIKNDTLYTYTGADEICKVPVGKWFNIATEFDMKNKCFSTYIDGVLVSDSLPWNCNDTSATQATQIRLAWSDGGDGIAYVDNFKAYNGTYDRSEEEEDILTSGICGPNLTWKLEDGTLTVSGTGAMNDFPTQGSQAWDAVLSEIRKVVVNDGVTSLGFAAFKNCTNLTTVSLPDTLKTIGKRAFEGCGKLNGAVIPNGVTLIDEFAFSGCTSLTSVSFPANLTRVAQGAFKNCSSLTTFALPDKVTDLGPSALSGCTKLETVKLSAKQPAINNATFANCTSLKKVEIPESVKNIAGNGFENCPNVQLYCVSGSAAHSFAQANNIPFVLTDAENPVVTVSSVKTIACNTVDVTISISGNTGITGAILSVNYDSALTLTNVASGDAFGSLTFANLAVPYLNPLVLSWDGESNDTSNGTLVTLTFAIPTDMPIGDYPIEITYKDNDIFDADLNNVVVEIENGQIVVKDFLYGDVNGDSVINGKDLTLIRRYITGGFELVKFNAEAADVNLDNSINGKDLTLIRRYISGGFGVELGW